jgi:hypothetical protein
VWIYNDDYDDEPEGEEDDQLAWNDPLRMNMRAQIADLVEGGLKFEDCIEFLGVDRDTDEYAVPAVEKYASKYIRFDKTVLLSQASDGSGAWVSAWLWVLDGENEHAAARRAHMNPHFCQYWDSDVIWADAAERNQQRLNGTSHNPDLPVAGTVTSP